jgi:L-malate glycosyltransferase
VNVLYVNHTPVIGGGERSLLSVLGALPDAVTPLLATPPGELMAAAERIGVAVTPIRGTAGSLRVHPWHTPVAIAELAIAGRQIRRAARAHRAQIVHANSIRAGLELASAGLPMATLVHVRDCLPPGRMSTLTARTIAARATAIVANSRYTAESLRTFAPRARIEVIYNAVDLKRFDPLRINRERARAALGAAGQRVLLGVVAQLTPWKGQDTAVEALRLLVAEGIDAHLLLVGSATFVAAATRFDNRAYAEDLRARVREGGLEDRVSWLGQREDVPELLRALDVLLAPSWEEPFGRSLIEAMALAVPVVAASVGGPAEIIEDGREGYLVAPRKPRLWAEAVRRIVNDPALAASMGEAGRRRVSQVFTIERHIEHLLDLYERARA